MDKPLSGVRVLEVDTFTAASACGRLLGEWGAEVIKVEMIGGEPGRYVGRTVGASVSPDENPSFEANNAYKKSLALNLKTKEGLEAVNRLADKCNVFFTNYRPNVLRKMGLDYETFHKNHPKTIWAQITGYGELGPACDDPGYDAVAFWARSGAMIDMADSGELPLVPLLGFGDRTTSCSLAGAICAALYHQMRTGEGQKISVSLYGQAIWNEGETIVSVQCGDSFPKSRIYPNTPIADAFKSSDGKWFYTACYNYDGFLPSILKAIDREELLNDERFASLPSAKKHGTEIVELLSSEFAKHDLQYWTQRMKEFDVPFSPINTVEQVLDDEQAFANGYLRRYKHRNGKEAVISQSPVRFTECEDGEYVNAPLVGEHSLEYLRLAGFSDDEIKDMIKSGAAAVL